MSYRTRGILLSVALIASMTIVVAPVAMAAGHTATIDFESLAEGSTPLVLDVGSGISGTDFGSVGVVGAPTAAMVFDATCTPGGTSADCSGGDSDLFQPANGNVLIITEDGDSSDPDDSDNGAARFVFDFSGWGPGVVTVESIDVLDVDDNENNNAFMEFDVGANVNIPDIGDGNILTIAVNRPGVSSMTVRLGGSGAIDNIKISVERRGGEGCTPGYYKNLKKHGGSWIGYAPTDTFLATFGVAHPAGAGATLIDALNAGGGGDYALGRHGVAALLNASNPDVDYKYTEAQVIAVVAGAMGTPGAEAAKNQLAAQNEAGCPIGNTGDGGFEDDNTNRGRGGGGGAGG